jgi:gliding motility-associated-like protein
MKAYRYLFIVLIALLTTSQKVHAQIDTVFWFAAPWVSPDHDGNKPMAFRISTFANPTTVRVQMPASVYDTTFTVGPNTVFSHFLTHLVDSLESNPADEVLRTGFKITSDELITVVYDFISDLFVISPGTSNNPETYSLKGTNGMGTEFVVPFQTLWNNRVLTVDNNGDGVITQPKQFFSVVATEDNTTIWISPRCNVIGGHPANVTYSVFLPFAGNVYTCENAVMNTNVPGNSLSGSIVVSDKPVSVTMNDDSVNPSGGGGCFDLMGDQIVPTDVIGNEYIVNRGFLNAGSNESIFIVAVENFTTVTVNNGITTTTYTLNQGQTQQYSITQLLTYVSSDKPVYVIHMSGYGCELGIAILPPLNCAGSDQVAFARNNAQQFLLNILCKAGTEGAFELNGNPALVPAGAFSPVPGTGGQWLGAQIAYNTTDVPVNTANLITNSMDLFSLGVINGGPSTGCLYHYMSSFLRRVITRAGNDTTLCNGEPFIALNGSVSGGTITGEWEVLDGTGTLNNPTVLVNSYIPSTSDYNQGYLNFVLSSTGNCNPVRDTMRVTFIQSPLVAVGTDLSYCKNNIGPIPISGAVSFASAGVWSGGNGGAIGNQGSLNTNYVPSPADLAADSVSLFLTSTGSFFSCPDDADTLVIYFTEPPAVMAGPDLVICSNNPSVSLNGSVSGATTTGTWSSNGSGSFAPSQNDLSTEYLVSIGDTTTGSVLLTLTSTNNGNCNAVVDQIQISIVTQPTIEITTADSICSNTNLLNLTGNVTGGFPTVWSVTGFGTITNPTSLNTTYTVSEIDTTIGFIDLFLTTAGFCPATYDSIRVFFIDPPILNAGIDQQFCYNEPILLNGSISGTNQTVSWSTMGTGGFSPGNNFLTTLYYPSALDILNGGVNLILSAPASFGCIADNDTLFASFKTPPVSSFSFDEACSSTNTVFTDNSTSSDGTINSWSWSFGDSGNSNTQNPAHTYPGYGNYNVSLIVGSSNGCFDTTLTSVVVHPLPVPMYSTSLVCQNMETYFTDNSFIPIETITSWNYEFYNGYETNDQNPVFVYTSPGSFPVTLTVTSAQGCTSSATTMVDVNPAPNADFSISPNPAIVLENVFFTDETTGNTIVNWFWNFGDGEGNNVQNPIHSYEDGGNFPVTLIVTDLNGCMDTAIRFIDIALLPVLPTGFTPNGDGENDIFIIRGGPFKSVDFKIYNNWGELIFTSTEQSEGWDGTFKSELSPLGVYTWTFVVEMPNGQIIRKSGDVTLIR